MDYLSRVYLFLEVAKQQSFIKAGQKFGITGSALSKQIQSLESRLGVKLFHRTTRQVTLTEAGAIYYEKSKQAINDLYEAEQELQETRSSPKGCLKVNMPSAFGKIFLVKPLSEFIAKYDEITMEVDFDDRNIDVIKEGYDLVVRIGALEDSSLIAKKVATCPVPFCASPEFLEKYGMPKSVEDLSNYPALIYNAHSNIAEWKCQSPSGEIKTISLQRHLTTDNAEMMTQACLVGVGVSLLPIFSCIDYIKNGQLIVLFPEYTTYPQRNIHIIYPQNRYLSNKVRLLSEALSEACKKLPWEGR